MSTAIYASETSKSMRTIQNKLDVFHQRNLRKIIGVTRKDKASNAEVPARTGQRCLKDIVGERRFRFVGHVMRMAPERPARRTIEWTPADGRKKEVDQRRLGDQHLEEDLQARGVSWSEKETMAIMAADRVRWQNLLPIVPQGTKRSKC